MYDSGCCGSGWWWWMMVVAIISMRDGWMMGEEVWPVFAVLFFAEMSCVVRWVVWCGVVSMVLCAR